MPTTEQIESFAQFAREQVKQRGDGVPLDELFDEWRVLNPPPEDELAVQASLRDMERGETGRPVEDLVRELRSRGAHRSSK